MTLVPESFTGEFAHAAGASVHRITNTESPLDISIWEAALSLDEFIARATVHQGLWQTTRRLAQVSDADAAAARSLTSPLRLLVLLEDWCGDAIHTIPVVLRLVESNPALMLRVVGRDTHEALMKSHLTGASRAIPVVIVYDASGHERGWWGPRPSALDAWVSTEGHAMEPADRSRAMRHWYERDSGATTAADLLTLLQHADAPAVVRQTKPSER